MIDYEPNINYRMSDLGQKVPRFEKYMGRSESVNSRYPDPEPMSADVYDREYKNLGHVRETKIVNLDQSQSRADINKSDSH